MCQFSLKQSLFLIPIICWFPALSQNTLQADEVCMQQTFKEDELPERKDSAVIEYVSAGVFDSLFSMVKHVQQSIPETVIMDDSLIAIVAGKKEFKYRNSMTDWYGYGGYVKLLGLHYMIHSDANAATVSNWLINEQSGETYHLNCPFGEGYNLLPYQSSSSVLVFYENSYLSNESVITTYSVEQQGGTYCLKKRSQNFLPWFIIHEIYQSKNGVILVAGEYSKDQELKGIESLPDDQYFKLILP
jgi:hypothetical protein